MPNIQPMRVGFMGSPDFAIPFLDAVRDAGHSIEIVFTQPPKPANRGKKITPCPVHAKAEEYGLEVHTPRKLGTEQQDIINAKELDVIIVVAYGLLLPQEVLDAPKYGCINVHPSLLPRWRGAAPMHWPIIKGDRETGVCIMQMEKGLDTGDILLCKKFALTEQMTINDVTREATEIGTELLVATLVGMQHELLKPIKQDDAQATYARKLEKNDGLLNFRRPASELHRLVRALNPWPGTFFNYAGEQIKVLEATYEDVPARGNPGEVIIDEEITNNEFAIICASSIFKPTVVKRPNRNPMSIDEMLNGFPILDGTQL